MRADPMHKAELAPRPGRRLSKTAHCVSAVSLDSLSIKAQPDHHRAANANAFGFNQEHRHVEGSKRQQGKQETEGGQEPAEDHSFGLQNGAGPGQAGQQPVREKKDLTPIRSRTDRARCSEE
jgi:hypothetical protein